MFQRMLSTAAFLAAFAATAASAQIELKFATDSGDRDSPSGKALAAWADAVKEGSNGEIDVKVFYQNELGGQLEVFDLFVAGEVDAMISWPSTSYDKRIGILNTPYMVTSWEEALDAYKPGGWANGVLNTVFNDIGLKYFGAWPEGFSGVATRGSYATDLAGASGMKVRTPPLFPFPQILEAMGYQTAAIDWGEVYTSIQTGVVDGDAGNVIYWDYEYFRDVLDYYVRTKHTFVTGNLLVNLETYEELTDEQKKLVEETATATMEAQFVAAKAEDEHYVQLAVDSGMEYFELTDEQLAPIVEKVRAEVWPQMEPDVGKDVMDLIRANVD
ncbi:TRAP transporter substrate-binding protein DctP [Defluviimonas aestuarii]|uniref:TRAP transporter substrate-binding protein DctP n=1 Tax=Albidovulum aestuarii TaxID=1130726 RepID=UPI00249AF329|nr:TRAP transporter substrate-binding protein DctP [Defluviimonas aestuarii]MDI3338842.1 TRAP transporter substrate-binding protein DctP [Defluviimonas aestuarii]